MLQAKNMGTSTIVLEKGKSLDYRALNLDFLQKMENVGLVKHIGVCKIPISCFRVYTFRISAGFNQRTQLKRQSQIVLKGTKAKAEPALELTLISLSESRSVVANNT
ncbi:hypothetical protein Tsubulata_019176 [Turnera subulata]|uniref:Uncharacterized protein n=1 Tax=Turnera subulata TaxID=218843 RepID=A0A9Q0JNW4_9ROSI|nr:hypothetical protein Tsubulata_019176 [Turnera subulata]